MPEVVGGSLEVPPEEVGCEWWRRHLDVRVEVAKMGVSSLRRLNNHSAPVVTMCQREEPRAYSSSMRLDV